MTEDYYERLGVDRDASESEIKRAFRERIKETHPDVSDDDAASDRTKRLLEAKDVLTDAAERERYDRLGHEAYVSRTPGSTPSSDSTQTDGDGSRSRQTATPEGEPGPSNSDQQTSAHRWSTATNEPRAGETTTASDPAGTADWYDTRRREQRTRSTDGEYQVWNTDSSYAVGDGPGMFSPRRLLNSQRMIVLLGTTFVIYPVLLFGALFPAFPTAVNLTVAMCIVLVIAFMQSVPQVGVLVFGIWTVLLPILLFGVVGVSVLSLRGILSLAAVLFPLGLSVLTWVAIRPTSR
ncbi:DnaJ domain-containing protein [Halovenus sp. WSH3]|uniref:DnaJ domain-containing protein n=1 Tax=Halovenus carboxidivorans TaxID=2692199 RepID=A0A6B0T2J7_9EURY|nr:DnaJ domain-containing protein [Halovenus carboxidivorans]